MTYEELEAKCWKLEHENNKLRELAESDVLLLEELTDRYIEAERFIIELQRLSVWDRVFNLWFKCQDFIISRINKYDF